MATTPKTPRGPNAPRTYVAWPKPGVNLPIRMVESTHSATVERFIGAGLYTVEPIRVSDALKLAKTVEVEVPGAASTDANATE